MIDATVDDFIMVCQRLVSIAGKPRYDDPYHRDYWDDFMHIRVSPHELQISKWGNSGLIVVRRSYTDTLPPETPWLNFDRPEWRDLYAHALAMLGPLDALSVV